MIENQVVFDDSLRELHTLDEECFCLPILYRDVLYHRAWHLIDQAGPENMFITGWVKIYHKEPRKKRVKSI